MKFVKIKCVFVYLFFVDLENALTGKSSQLINKHFKKIGDSTYYFKIIT